MRQPGVAYPRLALPPAGQEEDLVAFGDWLEQAIPLVGQLGLNGMCWEKDTLVWDLSLTPNLNDKGTGFGGALTAQTTLIGWAWTTLWLRAHGRVQDVVVAEARQRFLAPVTADYRLACSPVETAAAMRLMESLTAKNRGRIVLMQRVYCGHQLCLEAEGSYAVLPVRDNA
ncbi:YiiD C-terminal domain-containing protein [Halomonas sp. WWR20]